MPSRRTAFLIFVCGLAAASASAAHRQSDISWGKHGVSLEEYWIDGAMCSYQAVSHDLSDTPQARRLVRASRRLEHIEGQWGTPTAYSSAIEHRRIVDGVQPERLFGQVAEIQQEVLDACLTERGYRQFRLTDAQKRHLRRLEPGSTERRAFLHRLGSDPEVLRIQGIDTAPLGQPQG